MTANDLQKLLLIIYTESSLDIAAHIKLQKHVERVIQAYSSEDRRTVSRVLNKLVVDEADDLVYLPELVAASEFNYKTSRMDDYDVLLQQYTKVLSRADSVLEKTGGLDEVSNSV